MVKGASYNYGMRDGNFVVSLAAGVYFAVVTQYDNFRIGGLTSGFRYDNEPNFILANHHGGATQPFLNGVWDNNDPQTSFWRFHLLDVDQPVVINPNPVGVPQPMSMALFGTGLVGLGLVRRARKSTQGA